MATPEGARHRDLEQRFRDLERKVRELTSRVLQRPGYGVDDGDFTVTGGGSVVVEDGGGVEVIDGGNVNVRGNGKVQVWGSGTKGTMENGRFGVTTMAGTSPTYPSTVANPDGFLCDAGPGKGYAVFRVDETTGKAVVSSTVGQVMLSYGTTSDAANTRILLDGSIHMVTSSLRYKQDVEDADVDPAAMLSVKGRTWRDKAEVEADPDTDKRSVGFIAEELDAAGLGLFVDYDDEGRPDAIQYDRLTVGLLAVLQDQQATIEAMGRRLDALEVTRRAPDATRG